MPKAHKFTVGSFACAVLSDGDSRIMSLSATLPTAPETDLQTEKRRLSIATDDVEVGYNVLYIDTGTQKILIDTGLADGDLVASLAKIDIKPKDIETIFITHGDSDHVGGMLNFPNTRFVFPKDAWEQWTHTESRQALTDQFIHLFAAMRTPEQLEVMAQSRETHGATILPSLNERIDLIEPEVEHVAGIRFIAAPGHRSDHYAVEVSSNGETLIHVVDSIRHPFQVNNDWPSFIDSFPEQIVETNKLLVAKILDKNALMFGAHFPFPALAKIEKEEDTVVWEWIS